MWINLTGRLQPGVTIAHARAQLESLWPAVLEATASTEEPGLRRQRFLTMGLELVFVANGLARELRAACTRPLYVLSRNRDSRAPGAQRPNLRWMVLAEAMKLKATGIAVGIPCALGAARPLRSLLFGISSTDAVSLAIASLPLLGAGLTAGYLPARRAMRVDPIVALRRE